MIVSTMDTAKVPHTGADEPGSPAEAPAGAGLPPVTHPGPEAPTDSLAQPVLAEQHVAAPSGDRTAIRRERRQLRRQQRLYAAAGIAVLAAVFLVAVVVLGGIR